MEKINYKVKTSENRSLAYIDEFKAFINKNPKFISNTHNILKDPASYQNLEVGAVIQNDDITITKLESTSVPVFKVEKSGEAYFIKINNLPSEHTGEKGFNEFISTNNAKELLKDLPWVEVAESQLGYRDEEYAYYVSKWDDKLANTLEDYLARLETEIKDKVGNIKQKQKLLEDLQSKVQLLDDKIGFFTDHKYEDLKTYNMAYDEERNKIILFDLQTVSDR